MLGRKLQSEYGSEIEIVKELGQGGQGVVYLAKIDGANVAFKWYHKSICSPELKQRINEAIELGSVSDSFLWPQEMAVSGDRFGYVMPLLEDRFKSIPDLLARRIAPSFSSLIIAGYNLVNAFRMLHLKGKCYRDISNFNVLFDPENGDIKIIDNDNVMTNNKPIGEIISTSGFAAPEVMLGEKKPSTDTDLFSLSVLLFYLFFNNHPLEGRRERGIHCLDDVWRKKLYAVDPLYIFHPTDYRNYPLPGEQDDPILLEKIYPNSFKKLFEKAFTEGIKNPTKRVRETQWEDGLCELLNMHAICLNCGSECFIEWDDTKVCYNCQETLYQSPIIEFHNKHNNVYYKLLLHPKSKDVKATYVYPYHFKMQHNDNGFAKPLFEVVQNTKDPKKWGLRNLTGSKIEVSSSKGDTRDVESGRVIPIRNGLSFIINNNTAKIKLLKRS